MLSQSVTITHIGIGLYQIDSADAPTGMNWMLLKADGLDDVPGTLVAQGSGPVTLAGTLTVDETKYYPWYDYSISTGGVNLTAGSYYVAFQELGTSANYLGQGIDTSNRTSESFDGGSSWTPSYNSMPSIPVFVEGTYATPVPEPVSLALLMTGITGLVLARPRRRHDRASPTAVQ